MFIWPSVSTFRVELYVSSCVRPHMIPHLWCFRSESVLSYEFSYLLQSLTDTYIFIGNIRLHYLVPRIYDPVPMWLSVALIKHGLVLGITHKQILFYSSYSSGVLRRQLLGGRCMQWSIQGYHFSSRRSIILFIFSCQALFTNVEYKSSPLLRSCFKDSFVEFQGKRMIWV